MKTPIRTLIDNLEGIIAGVCFTLMVLIINVEVIRRYFFHAPGAYSEELARYLFIYSIFFAMAYCVRENGHLVTDILPHTLGRRLEAAITFVSSGLFLLFSAGMCWYGGLYTLKMYHFERLTEAMAAPLWYFSIALPLGFFCVVIRLCIKLYHDIHKYRTQS